MAEDAQVVFASAIEAMGKLLAQAPHARTEIAKLGINLDRPAAHPRALWEKMVPIAANGLFPSLPRNEQLRALGRLTIEHYGTGLIGSALFAVLKVIGPMRALHRTQRNFRTSNNYSEARLETRGPKEVLLWMNEVEFNEYTAGVVEAGTAAAGAKNVQVRVDRVEADGTHFIVTWD